MHTVGRIDREIYKCITEDIRTDEVIITDEQIQHIEERHPGNYKNSIITFFKIDAKRWKRYLRTKRILYKQEKYQ